MKRTRLLLLAALACMALAPAISSASVVRSGLRGSVRRGPTSPMCRPGTSCTAPAAGLRIDFVRDGVVHHVRTNARGRYSIHLAAGNYTIRIAGARFGQTPLSARVPRQRMAVLNISIDTGIR